MATCFVIQPFDGGKYDKRFDDIYVPAITAAELEPYRVDRDPTVSIPIESIEAGIRQSAICLADITTDNPNVWYELGFAFASGREVVMLCSDERAGGHFPFDIQHRSIIRYRTESARDFSALQKGISDRLRGLLERGAALRTIADSEQIAPVQGLTQPELAVLSAAAGSVVLPEESVSVYSVKHDVERAGFSAIGFSLGVRRLRASGLLEMTVAHDDRGNEYPGLIVTPTGWNWIERNQDKFIIHRRARSQAIDEADIPF